MHGKLSSSTVHSAGIESATTSGSSSSPSVSSLSTSSYWSDTSHIERFAKEIDYTSGDDDVIHNGNVESNSNDDNEENDFHNNDHFENLNSDEEESDNEIGVIDIVEEIPLANHFDPNDDNAVDWEIHEFIEYYDPWAIVPAQARGDEEVDEMMRYDWMMQLVLAWEQEMETRQSIQLPRAISDTALVSERKRKREENDDGAMLVKKSKSLGHVNFEQRKTRQHRIARKRRR